MIRIIIIFCIGSLLLAYPLFSNGMFMDGTIYAAVADNMALGTGTFWNPHFSVTEMNSFREHPPLAIGMESGFHWLLNGSFLSERIYSYLMWLFTGGLIVLVWNLLKQSIELVWLPLLIWMTIPTVIWCFSNNMLENTMGFYVLLSFAFYLLSKEKNSVLNLSLFGLSLCLAFLSKGFVGLFPLAFPFVSAVLNKTKNWKNVIFEYTVAFGTITVFFVVLFELVPESYSFIHDYLQKQVMTSLEKVETVSFRGQIVIDFLTDLIIPVLAFLALYLFYKKHNKYKFEEKDLIWIKILFVVCLLGVLPIMISLKQRGFYILTVYPFAAIALAILIKPMIGKLQSWLETKLFNQKIALLSGVLAVSLIVWSAGRVGRDKDVLNDISHIIIETGGNQTICLSNGVRQEWNIIAYLARFGRISVIESAGCKWYVDYRTDSMSSEALEISKFKTLRLTKLSE